MAKKAKQELMTVDEGKLHDCARAINEADRELQNDFYHWLEVVSDALQEARDTFGGKGRDSQWSAWLTTNTAYSRARANRIISASERHRLLLGSGVASDATSDSQSGGAPANLDEFKALEGVPEGDLAACWQAVVDTSKREDRPITAAMVRKVAGRFKPKRKVEPEESISGEREDGVYTVKAAAAPFRSIAGHISQALEEASNIAEERVGGHMAYLLHDFREAIKAVRGVLRDATPAGVCPGCDGQGCDDCLETGFINARMKRELAKQ